MNSKLSWLVKNSRIYKRALKIYHGLQGERLLTMSPGVLLLIQNKNGEFNRYDVMVRLMAIEEIDGISGGGLALYQKMQRKRNHYLMAANKKIKSEDRQKNDDVLGELLGSFKQNGFNEKFPIAVNSNLKLVDGSHRLACALYTKCAKLVVEKGETAEIDYGLPWFYDNLEPTEVDLVKHRYQLLLKSLDINSILNELLLREKQVFGRGGFYQSFEELGIKGQRPTAERYRIYKLDEHLHSDYDVLDIGCNAGFFTLTIANQVKSATGIEINQTLVEVAQVTQVYLNRKNVAFKQGNFNSINLKKKFDFICSFAVHHWLAVDMQKYGHKLGSLLNPGGKVLLESQNIHEQDKDWEQKLNKFIGAGFEEVDKGQLKDDGKIERKYSILQRI